MVTQSDPQGRLPAAPINHARRQILIAGAAIAPVITLPIPKAEAAPASDLWPRWEAHTPGSALSIDHGPWQVFLDRYRRDGADGIARVAYGLVTASDKAALDAYIDALQAVSIDGLDRPEQRAFWTNFYNAGTVQVVLNHWPVSSIRDIDISPGFFANGPWGAKLWQVAGERVSLDDIEHRILRPIWQDPRVHYTVNCAALGCPNLPSQAFTRTNFEAQADRLALAFVTHPRAVQINGRGQLVVNSIYHWFEEDFGGTEQGVLAHLRSLGDQRVISLLAGRHDHDGHAYDWSINATSGTA